MHGHPARKRFGEVCEWLKQQVSKTCKPQGFEGSNPSLSVEFLRAPARGPLKFNGWSHANCFAWRRDLKAGALCEFECLWHKRRVGRGGVASAARQ